jgi:hypothetical protein
LESLSFDILHEVKEKGKYLMWRHVCLCLSACLPATWYQWLNCLLDFHKIWYNSSLQMVDRFQFHKNWLTES